PAVDVLAGGALRCGPRRAAARAHARRGAGRRRQVSRLLSREAPRQGEGTGPGPFGWGKEQRTDEGGTIAIALPWRGLYALEVHHADTSAGKRGEEAYDVANYVTTLTLVQPEGMAMPPRP